MKLPTIVVMILSLVQLLLCASASHAQHLWWDKGELQDTATCLYGEIIVLATSPGIYYSSAGWWPGEPAGGYCGIQHNTAKQRRTIFSIWDTSPELRPAVTEADNRTFHSRFGGEGEGAHTHMVWNWRVGEVFRFFLHKQPGEKPDSTDMRYYIYDDSEKSWVHSATISSPNRGHANIATIGGGVNCFLENFSGGDKSIPKLAVYNIWLGTAPDNLKCLTRCGGDGKWGTLGDHYFLAEGDDDKLNAVFARVEKDYGKPRFGGEGIELPPIADRPLPAERIAQLKNLPRAPKVQAVSDTLESGKTYTIRAALGNKPMSGKNGARRAGTELVQDGSRAKSPAWRFEQVGDAFRVISGTSNVVIEAADSGQPARLQPRQQQDAASQLWQFIRVGDAYQIVSKANGLALDLLNNAEHDGAPIGMWDRKNDPSPNQLWILQEIQNEADGEG